ncbi:MAG: cyclic nucleotide-binding domain-containing protein, partial [Schwartzia sp.]|nr:cyclic nucleotide-binding domain-containing protein [Schwartzia sp. (in: firmicutes)]
MAGYHLDLHTLPLFDGLTAAETDQFLAGMNAAVRRYEKGKYILRAEEKNENIGVIVEGEIQVISEDVHGNESVSHSLERGALVGITSAVLPDKVMNLSLVATTNV